MANGYGFDMAKPFAISHIEAIAILQPCVQHHRYGKWQMANGKWQMAKPYRSHIEAISMALPLAISKPFASINVNKFS
jgi:hypothetical protein